MEPYILTIINFRLKYGSKIVAPNTNESSRNRSNRSNNNKEKVIKNNFPNQILKKKIKVRSISHQESISIELFPCCIWCDHSGIIL